MANNFTHSQSEGLKAAKLSTYLLHKTKSDVSQESEGSRWSDIGWTLTCQDDHVHPPEDAHDPSHHDDGRQDLDEGRRHVEPEHAALPSLRHQLVLGAAQHGERRDEGTCGTIKHR